MRSWRNLFIPQVRWVSVMFWRGRNIHLDANKNMGLNFPSYNRDDRCDHKPRPHNRWIAATSGLIQALDFWKTHLKDNVQNWLKWYLRSSPISSDTSWMFPALVSAAPSSRTWPSHIVWIVTINHDEGGCVDCPKCLLCLRFNRVRLPSSTATRRLVEVYETDDDRHRLWGIYLGEDPGK